ncbi:MAG TPA: hypothetical protein VGK32_04495 [Vicinamibacterales bacterium]|jgi:hypothetical protein
MSDLFVAGMGMRHDSSTATGPRPAVAGLGVPGGSAVGLEAAFWFVAIAIGAAQQWASVEVPSSIDLVSYLDIGDAWVHGRWADSINGYWNPLYSWILGVTMAVVRPSARFEYPTVEAVDFLIFLATLAAFAWFLRGVRQVYPGLAAAGPANRPVIPDWAWVVGGYTLFTWSAVRWISLSSNTPDMCGAALAFAAWGLLFRLDQRERPRSYVVLGFVLGLGYLSRTPLLFVGASLLSVAAWQAGTPARRRGLAIAALVLVATVTPFITAVSVARGHLTVGDNGKLNHAWLANPRPNAIPNRYWQGGPPGSGTPTHPARLIWEAPPAYEFGTPIGGTYPAWTDPSYWYDGLTYRFDRSAEWATLRDNAIFYFYVFGRWMLLALAVTLLVAGDLRATLDAFRRNARYWAPAVVGLGLYLVAADLHVQKMKLQPPQRYIAAFVVLLGVTLAFSVRIRVVRYPAAARRVLGAGLVAVSLLVFSSLASGAWNGLHEPSEVPPWKVASALETTGVVAGMRVATICPPDQHEYWARLARARIIADVPDGTLFWETPPEVREIVLERLGRVGAQVVVSCWVPPDGESAGWRTVPGTAYGMRPLRPGR